MIDLIANTQTPRSREAREESRESQQKDVIIKRCTTKHAKT